MELPVTLLVDFSNVAYSAFFSSLRIDNIDKDNVPEDYHNFVFSFHAKIETMMQSARSTRLYFVMDRKPVEKYAIYADYKKGRQPLNFDPKPKLINFIKSWNCKVLKSDNHEADDVIATYVANYFDEERIVVASTDKDLWQLCGFPNVSLYNFHSDLYIGTEQIEKAFSVTNPAQIKLYKTLFGDSSDNVPNILPRMQKSFMPLIRESDGSLVDFVARVEANTSSLSKRALELWTQNKEYLHRNYELVRLRFNCDIDYEKYPDSGPILVPEVEPISMKVV
jgi:5'-3' exonuclease